VPETSVLVQPNEDFLFTFSKGRKQAYRSGTLWREWRRSYPMLFDERDEELAITMSAPENGGSGFFEWLAAVLLYEATGLLSMQTNYVAKNHPRKRERFEKIIGRKYFDHVDLDQSGLPDLFVYSENFNDEWFFCEVKGASDKMRPNQIARHASLLAATGRKVKTMKLSELKA
jgi:hypothetical protein